ncbi:MAG: radical SAM protein [bacterium]
MPRALLVQPWIHDFAAYDLWVRPVGLLKIGGFLRALGVEVNLVDCLNPHHPGLQKQKLKRFPEDHGTFYKEEIPKPRPLQWFPRRYKRYGIPPALLEQDLKKQPRPDLILVSSGMTYWYPGVQETISYCRRFFPDVPVVLGGTYATLLPEHAREFSGADLVIPGGDWTQLRKSLASLFSLKEPPAQESSLPAWDLAPWARSICVRNSLGCPFRCSYCASHLLCSPQGPRAPQEVAQEIISGVLSLGVEDVVFYDDALLWEAESHLLPALHYVKSKLKSNLRFHCPNGLHARYLGMELARSLKKFNFVTLRLGLESLNDSFHQRTGGKLSKALFEAAVHCLLQAGYDARDIGVYVLAGLPGQRLEELEQSIHYVLELGLRPHIAEYSPIPNTELWQEAIKNSPFPISQEPLFQNNTLLPCRWEGFQYEDFLHIKASLHRQLQQLRKT